MGGVCGCHWKNLHCDIGFSGGPAGSVHVKKRLPIWIDEGSFTVLSTAGSSCPVHNGTDTDSFALGLKAARKVAFNSLFFFITWDHLSVRQSVRVYRLRPCCRIAASSYFFNVCSGHLGCFLGPSVARLFQLLLFLNVKAMRKCSWFNDNM